MSVCPSARITAAPTGQIFVEYATGGVGALSGKSVERLQIWLKSDKYIRHFKDLSAFHIVGSDVRMSTI
jgi:hypothetical protein